MISRQRLSTIDREGESPVVTVDASGRFGALIAASKGGNILFPFLRRRIEGRALRATGPSIELMPSADGESQVLVVTLSGTVVEVVDPPRWPREVSIQFHYNDLIERVFFQCFAPTFSDSW